MEVPLGLLVLPVLATLAATLGARARHRSHLESRAVLDALARTHFERSANVARSEARPFADVFETFAPVVSERAAWVAPNPPPRPTRFDVLIDEYVALALAATGTDAIEGAGRRPTPIDVIDLPALESELQAAALDLEDTAVLILSPSASMDALPPLPRRRAPRGSQQALVRAESVEETLDEVLTELDEDENEDTAVDMRAYQAS